MQLVDTFEDLLVKYEVPIGYRKAHLAVNNAEMRLSRERIIHREQQRNVVHDLTNAVADSARAYEACRNSMNRYLAASELLKAYEVRDQQDMDIDVDHLLDAQRRVAESEIRFYRARTEYAVALKNVHLEKGSLLAYHDLQIFDHQTNVRPVPVEQKKTDAVEPTGNLTPDAVDPEPAGDYGADIRDSAESAVGPLEAIDSAELTPLHVEEVDFAEEFGSVFAPVETVDPDESDPALTRLFENQPNVIDLNDFQAVSEF